MLWSGISEGEKTGNNWDHIGTNDSLGRILNWNCFYRKKTLKLKNKKNCGIFKCGFSPARITHKNSNFLKNYLTGLFTQYFPTRIFYRPFFLCLISPSLKRLTPPYYRYMSAINKCTNRNTPPGPGNLRPASVWVYLC